MTRSRSAAAAAEGADAAATHRRRLILLGACVLALVVGLATVTWPAVSWRFGTYDAGAALVTRHGATPYGQVVSYEAGHAFPNGVRADAYLIRRPDGTGERWLPRAEVQQMAVPGGASK